MEKYVIDEMGKMEKNGLIVPRNIIPDEAIKWSFHHQDLTKNFKASKNCLSRFMKQHNLFLRQKTKISQKLPVDLESKILRFQHFVIQKRAEYDFPLASLGNMDKTPV